MISSQIKNLQKFMLTGEVIKETNKYKLENDKLNDAKKLSFSFTVPLRASNPQAIMPTQVDKLFWCFFIMKHGVAEYYTQGHYTFAYEKQLKFKYVEQFRDEKELLKTFKISSSEIENQLANDSVIQMKTFFCLCAIEKLNVIYFNNNTYYEHIDQEGAEIHVVEKTSSNKKGNKGKGNPSFEYVGVINQEDLNVRRSRCFKLESLDKPLKCISAYKVTEVEDFCKQLQINIFTHESDVECKKKKKKSKTDLFHYLQKYLEIIK